MLINCKNSIKRKHKNETAQDFDKLKQKAKRVLNIVRTFVDKFKIVVCISKNVNCSTYKINSAIQFKETVFFIVRTQFFLYGKAELNITFTYHLK